METTSINQPSWLWGLLWMALLLGANAFFVAVEFALVTIRRSRVQELAKQGHSIAKVIETMHHNMDITVAGAQLGITLASLALGWVADETVNKAVSILLHSIPATAGLEPPRGLGVVVSFVLLSMTHVILGEQVPKSWALRFPETVIMVLAWPFNAFCVVCYPLISVMNSLASMCLKLFGVPNAQEAAHAIGSPDEFSILFEQSRTAGVLDDEEHELLSRALELRGQTVDRLMVPRNDIEWVNMKDPDQQLIEQLLSTRHARLAVGDGDLDQFIGCVRVKDVLSMSMRGERLDLHKVVFQPAFIPPTQTALRAMQSFDPENEGFAIVLDEFGGVQGLLTINDIVAATFGRVATIVESEGPLYSAVNVDEWLVDGRLPIDDLERIIGGVELEQSDDWYHTVAGLVIGHLQRIPTPGETLEMGDLSFKVIEMDGYRIAKLKVKSHHEHAKRKKAS